MIPLFSPKIDNFISIKRVLDSGFWVSGKMVEKFEEEFANYVGSEYAIGVNSCTSGLLLSFSLLSKKIVLEIPSVTFVSVANMGVLSGHSIKFIDDIFVGFGYKIGNTNVWDFAHEIYRDCFKKINNDDVACFSFYPTKNLGGLEGGMVCTNNKNVAEELKLMRSHGMKRDGYSWNYVVEKIGWKVSMNEVQAVIGLDKLNCLDNDLEKIEEVVSWYNQNLNLDVSGYHIYPVMVRDRQELMFKLDEEKIGYTVNFKPIHLQPAYQNNDCYLPKSEFWGEHELSLPLYSSLSKKEVNKICGIVKNYIL